MKPAFPWNPDGGIHQIPITNQSGALWLCGKHFIGPDVHRAMARAAADYVVCLTQRFELEDRYPDYVEWLGANEGTKARWFPIHDLSVASVDDTFALMHDLAERIMRGQRIIVHCAAGIGRAGTTAAGVLVVLGMSLSEALVHVRAHRPLAGPEAGPQMTLLEELEVRLGRAAEN